MLVGETHVVGAGAGGWSTMIANLLQQSLDTYLRGEISLSELDRWLAPFLPVLMDAPDSTGARLAGAIELAAAEFSEGFRTERAIKQWLRAYRSRQAIYVAALNSDPATSETTTSSSTRLAVPALLSFPRFSSTSPLRASA